MEDFDYYICDDRILCPECVKNVDGEKTGGVVFGELYYEDLRCSECGALLPVNMSWEKLEALQKKYMRAMATNDRNAIRYADAIMRYIDVISTQEVK
jgi:hypothetical protein